MDQAGSQTLLPLLLAHIRTAAPGLPLEPIIVQVLLLGVVAGNKNLILRTRDEDIAIVARLTTLTLGTVFGYNVHRLKCHLANQTPSGFLRSFFAITDNTSVGLQSHKHRHKNSRSSLSRLPVTSTTRSRRTSTSRPASESRPSRPLHLGLDKPDATANPEGSVHSTGARADTSVTTPQLGHASRPSTEVFKLPSVVVVSGLELTTHPSQKALLRALTERQVIMSDGHDLTLPLPSGFFVVYVCRSDPWERPALYKCLLDMFAMSSSVDVGVQTRLAMRQSRSPSSPSTTPVPALHSSSSCPIILTQSLAAPVISPALVRRLKHLCATQARIRAPLNIYLADLLSATRHYGPLDSMMLTVRARHDAEALARASRVLGTDPTGAELIREHAGQSRETDSTAAYPHSHSSIASVSSDALVAGFDVVDPYELADDSSLSHSLTGKLDPAMELDVSEADIARMFPRVVSHRIRVRDSPFDEILSSAVCGATDFPGHESQDGAAAQWERESVKDILVHILADV